MVENPSARVLAGLSIKVKSNKKLTIVLTILALFVLLIALAASVSMSVLKSKQKRMGTYKGRKVYADGVYVGEFKDGKKDGFGRVLFHNGDTYIGHWSNDTFAGHGIYTVGNRTCDFGFGSCAWSQIIMRWSNNRMECKGWVYSSNVEVYATFKTVANITYEYYGEEYIGIFAESHIEGHSHLKISDKLVYDGDMENNTFNGHGRLENKQDGTVYTGTFRNGTMDGQGVLKYNDGRWYNGSFKNGMKDGYGQFRYKNGNVYIGELRNDQPNGQGVTYFKKGDIHNGTYVDGYKHGQGWYKDSSGRIMIGQYAYESAVGIHSRTLPNGTEEMVHAYQDETSFWFLPLDYVDLFQEANTAVDSTTSGTLHQLRNDTMTENPKYTFPTI